MALGPGSGSRAGAQAPPPPPPPLPVATLTPAPGEAASPPASTEPLPPATASPAASAAPAELPSAAPSLAPESPAPTETPAPRRHGRHARAAASPGATTAPEPTATPTSPAFATLDGTWEVQLQYIDHTDYSYLKLLQSTGGALTGTWHLAGKNGATYPLAGNYDGRLIRIVVTEPKGPVNFDGYVEGASDMIGLVTYGTSGSASPGPDASPPGALSPVVSTNTNDGVAFTAEHRGKPSLDSSSERPPRHQHP